MALCRPAGDSDSEDELELGGFEHFGASKSSCSEQEAMPMRPQSDICEFPHQIPQYQSRADPVASPTFFLHFKEGRGRGRGRPRQNFYEGMQDRDQQPTNHWNSSSAGRGRGRINDEKDNKPPYGKKHEILSKIFQTESDNEMAVRISASLKKYWEEDQTENHTKFMEALKTSLLDWERQSKNVMSVGLFLLINCSDFTGLQGRSQTFAVITGLKNYINGGGSNANSSVTKDLQRLAFKAAVYQKKQNVVEGICDAFQLAANDVNTDFISDIERMCANKKYREACICAMYLKLHSHFDIHTFLIPLLLQDRFSVVEEYIKNSPELQTSIMTYLDGLFDVRNGGVKGTLRAYVDTHRVPDVKEEKLDSKPVSKLVKRLASKFKVDLDCCPNVGSRQRFGELRHMFFRKYEKQEMSDDSFWELINQIAEGSPKLQEDILHSYLTYMDYNSAAKFIITHQLYSSSVCLNDYVLPLLPEPHKSDLIKAQQASMVEESWEDDDVIITTPAPPAASISKLQEESWEPYPSMEQLNKTDTEAKKEFYVYPCLRETIRIVSCLNGLNLFCNYVDELQTDVDGSHKILSGFDSEWKPIRTKTEGAALLQIAFELNTYIIDIVSLKKDNGLTDAHWEKLRKSYFENQGVMKLGFDVKNDLKMLTNAVPEWQNISQTWKNVVDLIGIKLLLVKENPNFFNSLEGKETGLSELVYLCLGLSLSKAEQMSDWENRPLRESQILYAAGDAYCLIDVYKSIMQRAQELRLDLNKIIESYIKGCAAASATRKKLAPLEVILKLLSKLQEERAIQHQITKSPGKQVPGTPRFVCDNMFQGLGRHLRAAGFDTVIVDNSQCHRACCDYARRGRVVITKGVAYTEISSMMDETPNARVIHVKSETTVEQLEEICSQLNLELLFSDLFTVCQKCNSEMFIKLSGARVCKLMEGAGIRVNKRKSVESLVNERPPEDMILCSTKDIKKWTLLDESALQFSTTGHLLKTQLGAAVELNKISPTLARNIDWVYVCNRCGKCYWECEELEKIIRKKDSVVKENQIPA